MPISRNWWIFVLAILAGYLLYMLKQCQSNPSFYSTAIKSIIVTFFNTFTTLWFSLESIILCTIGFLLVFMLCVNGREKKVAESSLTRRNLHKSPSETGTLMYKYTSCNSLTKCPLHWIFNTPSIVCRKFLEIFVYPVLGNSLECPANRLASFQTIQRRNEQQSVLTLAQDGFYFDLDGGGFIRCIGCGSRTDEGEFMRGTVPHHFENCRRPANRDHLTLRQRLFGNRDDRDIDLSAGAPLSQNAEAPCALLRILRKNHPYSSPEKRENSFRGLSWANGNNSPQMLASQGFFYAGTADKVECFKCSFSLIGWASTPGLSLQEKHSEANRRCPFATHSTTEVASTPT